MDLLTWNSEQFSVGIDEMDAQHKNWIALINKLHASLVQHDSIISPEQAIREMIDYTNLHFAKEEALMREAHFPDYDRHKLEHEYFVLKLEQLDQDITNSTHILKTQIMSILKNWLADHICKADKGYGAFFSN